MNPSSVLIFAAHADDDILGLGASVARYSRFVNFISVYATIGDTARRGTLDSQRTQSRTANSIVGISKEFFFELPDQQLDLVPIPRIVKEIDSIIELVQPFAIFTHFPDDLNADHRRLTEAVLVATRRVPVGLYFYEIPNEPTLPGHAFLPNVFIDVSDTFQLKIDALNAYPSESQLSPLPRSKDALLRHAASIAASISRPGLYERFQLSRSFAFEA